MTTLKTITEQELIDIAKEYYKEGWNESRESYETLLARDGHSCGVIDNQLEEYLEEGYLENNAKESFNIDLEKKFNNNTLESLSNKEKINLIQELNKLEKEIDNKRDSINESLEDECFQFLKVIHKHNPISGFDCLSISHIDEDTIHFKGREYAGYNEYDYYDYELPLNLLQDEEAKKAFFKKYEDIENKKKEEE